MTSVTSTFNAQFSGKYALQLLQTASIKYDDGNHKYGASAQIGLSAGGKSGGAISTIMQIILDAKGNAAVAINAAGADVSASTGRGNDTVDITAGRVRDVSTHGGDDAIRIHATGSGGNSSIFNPAVRSVDAGRGNDSIDIESGGNVFSIDGNSGNDTIAILTTAPLTGHPGDSDNLRRGIRSTDGGNGDDTISLESATSVSSTDGGNGNDSISVVAAPTPGVPMAGMATTPSTSLHAMWTMCMAAAATT